MTEPRMLVQVTTPPGPRAFTAGLVFEGDRCIDAAPILKWCVGRSRDDLRRRFRKHRPDWKVEIVKGEL
jgi:hypothetical protein